MQTSFIWRLRACRSCRRVLYADFLGSIRRVSLHLCSWRRCGVLASAAARYCRLLLHVTSARIDLRRQPACLRRLRYHITTASCCIGSSATCSISPFSNCRCPSLAAACRLPLAAVRRLPPVAARGRRSLLAFSPPLATQRLGAKSCSTRGGCVHPLRALSSLQGRMCRKPRYATGFVSTQLFSESRHKPADASVPYICTKRALRESVG